MKIKEEMIEEFKKYLEEFDNYDKELEDIENKQNEHKEKVEKFNEKWGEDIFPSDKPIKEKEEEELKNFLKIHCTKIRIYFYILTFLP